LPRIRLTSEAVERTLLARQGHADLLALNEGLPAIMHTVRWKDAQIVQHYGRHLLAGRSTMARAAQARGRTHDATPVCQREVAEV
jgi:hypothetical protein